MDTDPKPPQTPAERHYEAMKKAQRDYWRRKHPNPRPVGRPRKLAVPLDPVEPLKTNALGV
jgi:hypothetical protein